MSNKPAPRTLEVLDKQLLTPNMLRLTLGGEAMDGFPEDQGSAYIKLRFHRPDRDRPIMRSYTIRHQYDGSFDLDFVRHPEGGPASRWAEEAEPGDHIEIGGPGPKKLIDPAADWFLIIGDMTALPAISVNIEMLPPGARGQAFIEVLHKDDIQELAAPENFDIRWIVNPNPGEHSDTLHQAVQQFQWLAGEPSVWCACEFNSMLKLRDHLRRERGVDRKQMYISSYWQDGQTDEQHKRNKKVATEAG